MEIEYNDTVIYFLNLDFYFYRVYYQNRFHWIDKSEIKIYS